MTNNVQSYFRDKADEYDEVDTQVYWVLSDTLLWHAIETLVLPQLREDFVFLDAGGGTGRWSQRIAMAQPKSSGVLYDLTPEMFVQAERKALSHGYADRLRIMEGDLADITERISDRRFDFIFTNALGFVQDPEHVIRSLAELLAPEGIMVTLMPSRWHAAFFNLSLGNVEEAESCLSGKGRFTNTMPAIFLFTPRQLRSIYSDSGLTVDLISGFPALIYPGYQETQLRGSTSSISELLQDPAGFRRIFEMERELMTDPEAAARGSNLFVMAHRASADRAGDQEP